MWRERRGNGVSANEDSCTHGAQINFGVLTPYLMSTIEVIDVAERLLYLLILIHTIFRCGLRLAPR
jgi:hypothetical protein